MNQVNLKESAMTQYAVVRYAIDNISPKVAFLSSNNLYAEEMKARLNTADKELQNIKVELDVFIQNFEANGPKEESEGSMKEFRVRLRHAVDEWVCSKVSPLAYKMYKNAGEGIYEVEKVTENDLIIW